ncbi:MAG: RNA polymerase sigma factor [Bacteroidota bacterium]
MSPSLSLIQSDRQLLERIRQGDEQALTVLYRENQNAVASFVMGNSGSKDDAEDMLQEALVVMWERVRSGRFELSAQLSTFLYATVKNIWLRRLARRRKEIPSELDPELTADGRSSILDDLIEDEHAKRIRAALQRLGEPCRTLLLLFYWEELSTEKIAAQMGYANAETVKAKKYQCKKSLEKILKQASNHE